MNFYLFFALCAIVGSIAFRYYVRSTKSSSINGPSSEKIRSLFPLIFFGVNLIAVAGFVLTLELVFLVFGNSYFIFWIPLVAAVLLFILWTVLRRGVKYEDLQVPDGSGLDKADFSIQLNVMSALALGLAALYLLVTYSTDLRKDIVIRHAEKSFVFDNSTQQVGATISGVISPVVALIAAYLTFKAFRLNARQSVINRFNEMLKWHRENLKEMKKHRLDGMDHVGRRLFTEMFQELKIAHFLVEQFVRKQKLSFDHEAWVVQNMATVIFFFGTDDKYIWDQTNYISFYRGRQDGTPIPLENVPSLKTKLHQFILAHLETPHDSDQSRAASGVVYFATPSTKFKYLMWPKPEEAPRKEYVFKIHRSGINGRVAEHVTLKYKPLQGHQSRLGHYFRHLYGILTTMERNADIKNKFFSKMVRQQLGNYEQAMLYFNASSLLGIDWFRDGYLDPQKFNLLHNLPVTLLNFGLPPRVRKVDATHRVTFHINRLFEASRSSWAPKASKEEAKNVFEWDEAERNLQWMYEFLDAWRKNEPEGYQLFFDASR